MQQAVDREGLKELRKDFPMLSQTMHGKPLIYFDSAATAQKPSVVIDEIADFYRCRYGTVHRAVYALSTYSTEHYSHVREIVRNFINAKSTSEIVFTRGTTEAINLVAYSFGKAFVNAGDEVIISESEHHSNIVPWQIMCEDRGANLRVIPVNDQGELDLQAFARLLNEKTKIVAVAHVSNALGILHPIQEIIRLAHQAGAKVLIDGAQAAPHLAIDVQELAADFYVFSGHKAYGPTGIGVLYGKQAILEQMPPYQGGGDMIKKVTIEKTEFQDLPLKFEAGTPMIAEVMGLGRAIRYLQQIGMDRIASHELHLLEYATAKLRSCEKVRMIGDAKEKAAIISFVIDGLHHLDIGTFLDLHGVAVRTGHHCAQPLMHRLQIEGTTRLSFALYNTIEEIDEFIDIMKKTVEQLG